MPNHRLRISGKPANLHGALVNPSFRASRVLCSDPWDFVSLWLKREHKDEASFYWEQARYFYEATKILPDLSSPLTSYYCFLNATKALLSASSQSFSESHGVCGRTQGSRRALDNEIVDFKGGGILPALCKFLGEPDNAGKDFTLKDIFWQIPFVHRAFCLTYKSATELFIPLVSTSFMRKDGSKEAWFQAAIDKRYFSAHTKKIIQPGFELFEYDGNYEVRRKRRFKWSGREIEDSIKKFEAYHKQIRRRIVPIYASENRWYLKKSVTGHDNIRNSQLVLVFAAMHRLSELSRYDPVLFNGHFKVNHNWLLSEFIKRAPNQFIYGVASEITGLEFIKPDAF
ncbi:YaaC family protein [Synechococcus sp. CS-1330]|nr:YaaC family protein [Synechococcus sp. CS-1330]